MPTGELKEILLLTEFCNVMYLVNFNVYMQYRLVRLWCIKRHVSSICSYGIFKSAFRDLFVVFFYVI